MTMKDISPVMIFASCLYFLKSFKQPSSYRDHQRSIAVMAIALAATIIRRQQSGCCGLRKSLRVCGHH